MHIGMNSNEFNGYSNYMDFAQIIAEWNVFKSLWADYDSSAIKNLVLFQYMCIIYFKLRNAQCTLLFILRPTKTEKRIAKHVKCLRNALL